jgi:hypothetical protein
VAWPSALHFIDYSTKWRVGYTRPRPELRNAPWPHSILLRNDKIRAPSFDA